MQISSLVESVRSWTIQFMSIDAAQSFYEKHKNDARLYGFDLDKALVRFHTYEQMLGDDLARKFEQEWLQTKSETKPEETPEKTPEKTPEVVSEVNSDQKKSEDEPEKSKEEHSVEVVTTPDKDKPVVKEDGKTIN